MFTYVDWSRVSDPHPAGLPNLRRVAAFLDSEDAYTPESSVTIPYLSKNLGISDTQLRGMLINSPKPGIVTYEYLPGMRRFYLLKGWAHYPDTYSGKRGQILIQKATPDVEEKPDQVIESNSGPSGADNTALVLELTKAREELAKGAKEHIRATKSKPVGSIKVDYTDLEKTDDVVTYLAQQFTAMVNGDKEAARQCLLISASLYMKE